MSWRGFREGAPPSPAPDALLKGVGLRRRLTMLTKPADHIVPGPIPENAPTPPIAALQPSG